MLFNKIVSNIKSLKIQGAEAVARSAAIAMQDVLHKSKAKTADSLIKELNKSREILLKTRPTEPAMQNSLKYITYELKSNDLKKIKEEISRRIVYVLEHFDIAQKIVIGIAAKKVKSGMVIFTHCHSSTVNKALIKAKQNGTRFEVHNTETRPLFQGRLTARDLSRAHIPVTHYVDSAARLALKKSDLMFLGADAITAEGKVINKIGSELISEVAYRYDIPIYICTDSWKFDPTTIKGKETKIEERSPNEIWDKPYRGIKIANYAFEKIESNLITGVITELGIYKPQILLEEIRKAYPWMFKI